MASEVNKPVPVPKTMVFGKGVADPGDLGQIAEAALFPGHGAPVPVVVKLAKAKKAKATKPAAPVPVTDPVSAAMAGAPDGIPGVPLLGTAGTKIAITVPMDLVQKITKPITGMGGWQRVMLDLQAALVIGDPVDDGNGGLVLSGTLALSPYLLARLVTLAVKHGSGGYQAPIRHIVCLAVAQHPAGLPLSGITGGTNGQ